MALSSSCCYGAQVIGLPTLLWLAFLAWRAGPSLRKLQRSQSHIMTTYYAFLWVVGLLNVLRCAAYIGQVESSRPLLLNLLWLLTRFGKQALPFCTSSVDHVMQVPILHMLCAVCPNGTCCAAVCSAPGQALPA